MGTNMLVDVVPSDELGHTKNVKYHKTIALVPACNEAETIEKTIHSLMAQTYPFECVRVIANNCTDDTVEIVQMLQAFYESIGRPELQLLVMAENKGKKSGALNYGLATVEDDIEFVFGMDGDTIVDERMIEEGIIQFSEEPKTGGICSAYRTLPLGEGVSHWKRFLWRLQNIEFTLANAWRVENYKSARVLPGVSVMFRMEALVDVATLGVIIDRLQEEETTMYPRKPFTKKWLRCIKRRAIRELQATKQKKVSLRGMMLGGKIAKVWATNNLVEDYRLTLDLKDIGWQVKSSLDMISWSDVPLRLRGKGGLWDQRQRWYSGTIDELRLRRLKRHSRYEIFTIFLLMLNRVMRFVLVSAYAILAIKGVPIRWVSFFLVLPVMASLTSLYRLKGGDQLDKWQIFFTGTLVVTELYAFYRELIYAYSICVSFFKPNRGW